MLNVTARSWLNWDLIHLFGPQTHFLFLMLLISASLNKDVITPPKEMNLTFPLPPTVVNATWNQSDPMARAHGFVSRYRKLWNAVCLLSTHTILASPCECVIRLIFSHRATIILHTHVYICIYIRAIVLISYRWGCPLNSKWEDQRGAGFKNPVPNLLELLTLQAEQRNKSYFKWGLFSFISKS